MAKPGQKRGPHLCRYCRGIRSVPCTGYADCKKGEREWLITVRRAIPLRGPRLNARYVPRQTSPSRDREGSGARRRNLKMPFWEISPESGLYKTYMEADFMYHRDGAVVFETEKMDVVGIVKDFYTVMPIEEGAIPTNAVIRRSCSK